jgi:hypothetical protein
MSTLWRETMNDIIKMLDSHIRFGTPVTTDFLKTIRALLEDIENNQVLPKDE